MPDIHLHLDGRQQGPYSATDLRNMIAAGLPGVTPAWHEGLSEWSTVAAVVSSAGVVPPVVPGQTPPLPRVRASASKGIPGCWLAAMICGGVVSIGFFVLAGIAVGPINKGIEKAKEMVSMQKARVIALAMNRYALDHHGAYPDGRTSTEVFQKLLDANYISDPEMFYFEMPGKYPQVSGKLGTANVCFDVTAGITGDTPDDVPVVFSEGYRVSYAAGATALPDPDVKSPFPGMAVACKNDAARFIAAQSDGDVPEVIPADFVPGKETCRQLKP